MSGTGKSTIIARLASSATRWSIRTTQDSPSRSVPKQVENACGVKTVSRRFYRLKTRRCSSSAVRRGTRSASTRSSITIVLLSAPADVLVERLHNRTNNPYGKTPGEVAETLRFLTTVEPVLRSRASVEIDATAPLEHVVSAILQHVLS